MCEHHHFGVEQVLADADLCSLSSMTHHLDSFAIPSLDTHVTDGLLVIYLIDIFCHAIFV